MINSDEPEDRTAALGLFEKEWTENSLSLCYGKGDGNRPLVRERLVSDRMRALFDEVDIRDRFTTRRQAVATKGMFRGSLQWEEYRPAPLGRFELDPPTFLEKAQAHRPAHPEATASAFAGWVYSLYGRPGQDEDAMSRGLEAEKAIWALGREHIGPRAIWTGADPNMLARRGDGWRLVHQGLHLKTETVPFFELPELSVRGVPMRASPDLVFRNTKTGHVLVVEIKLSRQPLPSNLWPNVWAQLWIYSHLPVVQQAPQVTVTGEVWGEKTSYFRGGNTLELIYLRAVVRRDPRAPAYDRFFRALFDIYRGEDVPR